MSAIHIRFNTKHNNETKLVWRVFEDGVEHLVENFHVHNKHMTTDVTYENGENKWNLFCEGTLEITNDIAYIF